MTAVPLDLNINAQIGSASYNGFVFPPAIKSSVEFVPEYSDDGRTVKYVRLDISIDFVFVDGLGEAGTPSYDFAASTDSSSSMPNLRKRLNRPGQKLVFSLKGIGDFRIQDGTKYDVNNGPKPRVISWKPIGGNKACRIQWRCSTWVPECDAQTGLTGVAQFRFAIEWDTNYNGLTNRRISGSAEIPMSRDPRPQSLSANTIPRGNADQIWEDILKRFPTVPRYERRHTHSVSDDRKTLTFSISDNEIASGNPTPYGIARIKRSRSASSAIKSGFTQWACTASARIEVAPGFSFYRAWLAFALFFDDVFNKRTKGTFPSSTTTDTKATQPGATNTEKPSCAFITSMDIREDVDDRTFSFSFTYLLTCTLKSLFDATGLFTPLTISTADASWSRWRTSLDQFDINGPRGWNGDPLTKLLPKDDVIVDLCDGTPNLPGLPAPDTTPLNETVTLPRQKKQKPGIDPRGTWLLYEAEVELRSSDGTVTSIPLHQGDPLTEPVDAGKPDNVTEDTIQKSLISINAGSSGEQPPPAPIMSRVKATSYRVIFTGRAARVGFPIAAPNLKSVGGKDAVKIGTDIIRPTVVTKGTDVSTGKPYTVYGLSWRKEYMLKDKPDDANVITDGAVPMYP